MGNLGNKEIMSKNILYYMEKNQKTRNEMCEALGVKYTTFTDWVKGNSYPRIDKIELMANYFGISKSDLVEDHNNIPTPEILTLYNSLDAEDQSLALGIVRQMAEQDKYKKYKKELSVG